MQDSKFSASASEFEKEMAGQGNTDGGQGDGPEGLRPSSTSGSSVDDQVAYKIPPFNIINKKSEHITKVSPPRPGRASISSSRGPRRCREHSIV